MGELHLPGQEVHALLRPCRVRQSPETWIPAILPPNVQLLLMDSLNFIFTYPVMSAPLGLQHENSHLAWPHCLPLGERPGRQTDSHPRRTSALQKSMLSLSFQNQERACNDRWVFEKNQPRRRIQMNKHSPDPRENNIEEDVLSHSNSSAQRDSGRFGIHKTETVARKIKHSGSKTELSEMKDTIANEKKVN